MGIRRPPRFFAMTSRTWIVPDTRPCASSTIDGVVTRTEFGRVKDWKPQLRFRPRWRLATSERFISEDAERAAGCEMALDVERVLDGGVNRQELLG